MMRNSRIHILIAMVAIFTLGACSSNEIDQEVESFDQENSGAMEFFATRDEGVIVGDGAATKAERITTFTGKNTTLSVFGYHCPTGSWDPTTAIPDIFYNQQLENSTGYFLYNPTRRWPAKGGVKFFGCYPEFGTTDQIQLTSTESDAGYPQISFTSSTTSYEQKDLMTATTDVRNSRQGTVPLTFKHRLARLGFKITNGYIAVDNSKDINIINFKIDDVMTSANGTYTDGATTTLRNEDGSHNTDGFEWGELSNPQTITAELNPNGSNEPLTIGSFETKTAIEDFEVTLLPQDLTGKTITATYTIGDDPTEKQMVGTIEFKAEQSYEYLINIKFKDETSYIDVDENGTLIIDVIGENIHYDNGGNLVTTEMDNALTLLAKLGASSNTVKFIHEPEDVDLAFQIMDYVIGKKNTIKHYDFSEFIIPEGTYSKFDDDNRFCNNTVIESIIMPKLDDADLGDNLFQNCSNLKSVTFDNESTITSLPMSAFNGCSSITNIDLSGITTLKDIMLNAFNNCTSLTEIKLPDSVETIADNACNGCSKLSKINIPATMTTLGYRTFYGCTSLWSYGENKGIIFEDRTGLTTTPITIGWQCFVNSHVRYQDVPAGYVGSQFSANGYFSAN